MTTCQTLTATVNKLNALQEKVTNITSFLTDLTDNSNDLSTFANTRRPQDDLVSQPDGLRCRNLTGGKQVEMDTILPGGWDFTVCQPETHWTATASAFSKFMPQGATWTNANPDPICTPFPGNGLFHGSALLCADTLPSALALAVDMRTIRERCSASSQTVTPPSVTSPVCTVNTVLQANTWCDTVPVQAACDTTSLANGLMCKWKDNKCMGSRQAGEEMSALMCEGKNPSVMQVKNATSLVTTKR